MKRSKVVGTIIDGLWLFGLIVVISGVMAELKAAVIFGLLVIVIAMCTDIVTEEEK